MKDYTESAATVFLFTIAEWLESRASYKASAVMQSLMSLAPQKAVIAETGEEVEVDEVKINTVLAVKAGETIPIDGVVVDGNCEVDEKTLTGEAFPVPKLRDSSVWAGTMNLNGYISVKTTALAEDCVVAKMAKLVEEAQNSKTQTQRFIDKCSQYYTPAVVIISACFAIIPVALRVRNPSHWFRLALVVLVSACPCGLLLSTPVATFCALTKAATSGLLIKGGDYLETLSKIKIAAFDKTGTITRGEFTVMDFRSLSGDISVHSLLYWVSSIESKSSHPMAAAIVDYAKSVSVEPKHDAVEEYQNFPGEGICGKIDGKDVYIGNKRIASRAGCSTDIEVDNKGGKTVGYIYVGERLAGVFNLSDSCRTGAVQAMKELKSLGVKTAMLTGDNQDAAMHAQEQLGNALEVVHSELLPQDKARIIEEFKREGATAMVGDGLNDAPALATADIGISMGISGSALATQTGHIILMSNDIRKIPEAIELARRASWKVIQNVVLSISIKGGILVLAFAGHPLIWAAVLADVGTCLLVILNSMLLLRGKHKPVSKCHRAFPSVKGDDHQDIETGLLGKSRGDEHCSSGCCGKNDQENEVRLVEGLQRKSGFDHCHSGCYDKKIEDDVKLMKQSCCAQPHDDFGQALKAKHEGHSDSGCCKDRTQSSCHKSAHSEKHHQMKSSSGCCGDKNEKAKEKIVGKSCCEKPHGHVKSSGDNGSGRCEKEEIEDKIFGDKAKEKVDGNCKSGCCGKKEKAEENIVTDLEKGLQIKSEGNCKSGCCGTKEKAEEKIVTLKKDQSDLEKGLQIKSEGNCKSGCCGKKEKAEEKIETLKKDQSDLGKGLQVKPECKSGCCSSKHEVEEGHHEKNIQEASAMKPVLKDEKNCRPSCCGSSKPEMERGLGKSFCSNPSDEKSEEQSCCLEKSMDACRTNCEGNEKQNNGGGKCCRSYANQYCGHGRHVRAFGSLTEIAIE
ncbi:PREDICTED: cadmium/zinc-transporting ATPase HMA3 isoform X1 [Tarenaya hassleriana]|uniref:cadmium/zinc-transporting ATPase HMA3 isoform X1 n=1 Tax=Tarenaya hassleriana TaxID=28532 RepID=UPI0008FD1234|nr:PREDICTED: cadmium/zinc-transporting ATPase HMA3 isoform X1 [Tarenaya hassleriana]